MSDKKLTVGVIFGGKSAEHQISLLSAKSIIEAINRDRFDVALIGIDKDGSWKLFKEADYLLNSTDPSAIALSNTATPISLSSGDSGTEIVSIQDNSPAGTLDVAFPVLHGTYGEDGCMQGLLKLAGIPFVGAGVLGSAVGMDKDVMKRLIRDAGIPTPAFRVFHSLDEASWELVQRSLGSTLFVKPCNAGSSVGVSCARSAEEFAEAMKEAFKFDRKVIVEQAAPGRELECSVLGNETPIASVAGEICPSQEHGFYSYASKYLDEKGAQLIIPAELTDDELKRMQELAIQTYKVLCCEGMARVDFFLSNDTFMVNEVNTIPGFTSISMYPKLWEASGVPYTELISRLIDLAVDRFEKEKCIEANY